MDKLINKIGEPLARPHSRASFLGLMGKTALGMVAAVVGGGAGLTLDRSLQTAHAAADLRCCPGHVQGMWTLACPLEQCPLGTTGLLEGNCCQANDCVTKITLCYNCFDDDNHEFFCAYSKLSTQTCPC